MVEVGLERYSIASEWLTGAFIREYVIETKMTALMRERYLVAYY